MAIAPPVTPKAGTQEYPKIRRAESGMSTTAPPHATAIGIPLRQEIAALWGGNFLRVLRIAEERAG